MNQPNTFCQSCGMPLNKDEQGGGTNADGSKSTMYCSRCYQAGSFKNPKIATAPQMQAFVQNRLKEKGFPTPLAWLFTRTIPSLARWKAK